MNTISFPRMFNQNSAHISIDMSTTTKSVVESLNSLLKTNRGELLGDPNYGTNIHKMLFDIKSSENVSEIKSEIVDSIHQYIPQIVISENYIKIYSNPNNSQYKITIQFKMLRESQYYLYEIIISQ